MSQSWAKSCHMQGSSCRSTNSVKALKAADRIKAIYKHNRKDGRQFVLAAPGAVNPLSAQLSKSAEHDI